VEKEGELRAAHKDLQMLSSMMVDINVMLEEQVCNSDFLNLATFLI
jgi:hypothetical protein